jgi:transcriptional regulator with XRE-family HTH domain
MRRTRFEVDAERTADALRRRLAEDLVRLMADSGVTFTALMAVTGLSRTYIGRLVRGAERPSLESYVKLATALGADLSARLYPHTGPVIRDRHQGRLLEVLLEQVHPRWHVFTELAVRRPARGWIDAGLHDPRSGTFVAVEIQSELRRLEQTIRWSREKANSLPSWSGWTSLEPLPEVSQLLVVRRTRATANLGRDFGRQLAAAFPAHPDDALASLLGTEPWPGPTLVWATIERGVVRFLRGRQANGT